MGCQSLLSTCSILSHFRVWLLYASALFSFSWDGSRLSSGLLSLLPLDGSILGGVWLVSIIDNFWTKTHPPWRGLDRSSVFSDLNCSLHILVGSRPLNDYWPALVWASLNGAQGYHPLPPISLCSPECSVCVAAAIILIYTSSSPQDTLTTK